MAENLDVEAGFLLIGQLGKLRYPKGLARMVHKVTQTVEESPNKHIQLKSSMGKFFSQKSHSVLILVTIVHNCHNYSRFSKLSHLSQLPFIKIGHSCQHWSKFLQVITIVTIICNCHNQSPSPKGEGTGIENCHSRSDTVFVAQGGGRGRGPRGKG